MCKRFLNRDEDINHGYGLTPDQARRAMRSPQLIVFIEEAVHLVWRENGYEKL